MHRPLHTVPLRDAELESELAVWLWEMHWAENHPQAAPPASPSCTPLTDSMMLLVVQSIPAKDFYGLHTKSLPVGINAKVNRKSSEEAENPPVLRGGSSQDLHGGSSQDLPGGSHV